MVTIQALHLHEGVQDTAIHAVLKMVDAGGSFDRGSTKPSAIMAVGDGGWGGTAGVHSTFSKRLLKHWSGASLAGIVVKEQYTSVKCACCQSHDTTEYVSGADISFRDRIRVKYCRQCHKWFHRDVAGGENIAVAGEAELRGEPRPSYLCRPSSLSLLKAGRKVTVW
jgi:hypothetical protein